MGWHEIQTTMQTLQRAGLQLTLTPEKDVKVKPARAITDAMRVLIVSRKHDIVAYLSDAANDSSSSLVETEAAVRWCYTRTHFMKAATIDFFSSHLARFNEFGIDPNMAHRLVERLMIRDAEKDGRAMCLECTHLRPGLRCANWHQAGVAIRASDAHIPTDLAHQLQRCGGFKAIDWRATCSASRYGALLNK